MNINLNIDEILQHVLPWQFSVTIGGVEHFTRRPSIGELGAMQAVTGKKIEEIEALLNSLFTVNPQVRWDLATAMVFLEGYLEYFRLHSEKKSQEAAGKIVSGMAKVAIQGKWNPPSSGG
jgi:hypothetical protein